MKKEMAKLIINFISLMLLITYVFSLVYGDLGKIMEDVPDFITFIPLLILSAICLVTEPSEKSVPKKYQKTYVATFKNEYNEKILVVTKVGKDGTEYQKRFSIKHLLNENYEVTDETLKEEEKMFKKPIEIGKEKG